MLKMIIIDHNNQIQAHLNDLDLPAMNIDNVGTFEASSAIGRLSRGDISIAVVDKQCASQSDITDVLNCQFPKVVCIVAEGCNAVCTQICEAALNIMEQNVKCITMYLSKNRKKNPHSVLNKAIEYMEEHFDKQVSLESVAKQVYVNPAYLSHIFKKHTGEHFTEYLTSMRINYAKQLLRDTEYKIYEIGKMVGFVDSCYFSTVFKKHEGISPNEYRVKR
ncbi:MAG: helix-turn-helix domain-containing protein [Clostridia bacterium]|nr:helix-turn-helix domain-containing protein [Clostridia bacterium]